MLVRIALLLLGISALVWPATANPQRIVSINLCTDELLLRLADPAQIAALSTYATDERLSFLATEAKAFRHDAADAETVVGLDPDLVLAGRFTKRDTRDILRRLGYLLVELDPARSVDDSIAAIREVASLTGHPERGEELVAEIEAARRRAKAAVSAPKVRPTVVFYQRRGYVTGGATLTGELLGDVGLDNAGGTLAGGSGGFVPLEKLIANPPDYLILSSATARAEDQGSALLAHPALLRLFPSEKRIALPDRLTVCGGPSLPAAFDWLAAQAQRIAPP
ncbi:MAG TPA: ABC transporter substrate-binding protein [Bauldia sp.]|nr:ABC transporter substrate-binding protein [Bauldia sp.]